MIVFLVNGVLIIDYKNIIDDEINTDYLSDHTMNTWQSDRTAEDKLSDTLIGKHAEAAVETALNVIGITDYHPMIALEPMISRNMHLLMVLFVVTTVKKFLI